MSGHGLSVKKETTISNYVVEILLEIEFLYGRVRKLRHQLADYSCIFISNIFHTQNIKNLIFSGENVLHYKVRNEINYNVQIQSQFYDKKNVY